MDLRLEWIRDEKQEGKEWMRARIELLVQGGVALWEEFKYSVSDRMRMRFLVKIAGCGDGVQGDGGFKGGAEGVNIRSGSRKLV